MRKDFQKCSTLYLTLLSRGFAQNLANKLNTVVYAPTNIVWAYSNGKHIIAPRSKENYNQPDLSKRGKFVAFYPGGNKKWKK